MKLEAQLRFPAGCDQVMAVTVDPAFQDEKCRATGALSHSVEISPRGDHTIISTTRRMPTDELPDFVKSMVTDGITVTEVDDWGPATADGSRDGTVDVRFAGAPIAMKGTLTLRPDGTGAVTTVRAELKAGIPLIGGRIEKACAQAVLAAIGVEERTANAWLTSAG
jgi:hypothetical protein